jgi:site-specific DNA-cytosine methylase
MRAVGLLAGCGSMLHEARAGGFTIGGNVELRSPFFRRPWWAWNFPEAPIYRQYAGATGAMIKDMTDADLALGHPPCGAQSNLGHSGVHRDWTPEKRAARHARRAKRVGLLPEFIAMVRAHRPTMFAMDNLPKMLDTIAPPSWWAEALPEYDCRFIVIRNWDYGTVQRRPRLWVIGARRKRVKPFAFRPLAYRPKDAPRTTLEALDGLPWEPWHNDHAFGHVHLQPQDKPIGGYRFGATPADIIEHAAQVASGYLQLPPKHAWPYTNVKGRLVQKIGWLRVDPHGLSRVIAGLNSVMHPLTGWPLTPRERARLMGWPDDYVLNGDGRRLGRWDALGLAYITGKGVPSDFVRYLIPQLHDHLQRGKR